jgi:hypothetical protein
MVPFRVGSFARRSYRPCLSQINFMLNAEIMIDNWSIRLIKYIRDFDDNVVIKESKLADVVGTWKAFVSDDLCCEVLTG